MPPPRAQDPSQLTYRIVDVSDEGVSYQGQLFPASYLARLTHANWPAEVDLHVVLHHERGPVAVGLVVVPGPLTDEGPPTYYEMLELLRKAADVGELLRETAAEALRHKVFLHLQEQAYEAHPTDVEARLRAVRESAPVLEQVRSRGYSRAEPRRRRLLTETYLREVAQTYREALASGEAPTRAVEVRYGTSYSNATKLVRKARDMGLLGAATGTRPGEAQT